VSIGFGAEDRALLERLNERSWRQSFSPDDDIAWANATTSRPEYRSLYDAWSLLLGSRHEATLSDEQRVRFAMYQQMNLMLATALFERYALPNFESLYRDDPDPAYHEYVSHLIKEETYHYVLFSRAVAAMLESDPGIRPLPERPLRAYLKIVLLLLRWLPSRRLRHGTFFYLLDFVEQTTLHANRMTKRVLDREDSLVRRVWELHAMDEARHVAFDDLMMRRAELPGILRRLPHWLAFPLCAGASLLINFNEICAARRLGVRVQYHELASLFRGTTAPFKRTVFGSLFPDRRSREEPL